MEYINIEKLILGKELAETALRKWESKLRNSLKEFKGSVLEMTSLPNIRFWTERDIILGTHVTADAERVASIRHWDMDRKTMWWDVDTMPIVSPINYKGYLTEEAGSLCGLFMKRQQGNH